MSLFTVKSLPNRDVVQTEARLARAVYAVCYVGRRAFEAASTCDVDWQAWAIRWP